MSTIESSKHEYEYPWSATGSGLRMTWRMTREGLSMRWTLETSEWQPGIIEGNQQPFFDAA